MGIVLQESVVVVTRMGLEPSYLCIANTNACEFAQHRKDSHSLPLVVVLVLDAMPNCRAVRCLRGTCPAGLPWGGSS